MVEQRFCKAKTEVRFPLSGSMQKTFYSSLKYRGLQRTISKKNWRLGKYSHLKKQIRKKCSRKGCDNNFLKIPSDPKVFCSSSCAASVSNIGRCLSQNTKNKIAFALAGRPNGRKGIFLVPRVRQVCANISCEKIFFHERWKKHRKFCSNVCAIKSIGSLSTSPRAARAKAGIRADIDSSVYFYSRWEANFARILNFLHIKWVHQPRRFRLKNQVYTPDFYLPELDKYIEIKNFLSDYSQRRDQEFRELYPELKLILILKNDYQNLEKLFASSIKTWEYS